MARNKRLSEAAEIQLEETRKLREQRIQQKETAVKRSIDAKRRRQEMKSKVAFSRLELKRKQVFNQLARNAKLTPLQMEKKFIKTEKSFDRKYKALRKKYSRQERTLFKLEQKNQKARKKERERELRNDPRWLEEYKKKKKQAKEEDKKKKLAAKAKAAERKKREKEKKREKKKQDSERKKQLKLQRRDPEWQAQEQKKKTAKKEADLGKKKEGIQKKAQEKRQKQENKKRLREQKKDPVWWAQEKERRTQEKQAAKEKKRVAGKSKKTSDSSASKGGGGLGKGFIFAIIGILVLGGLSGGGFALYQKIFLKPSEVVELYLQGFQNTENISGELSFVSDTIFNDEAYRMVRDAVVEKLADMEYTVGEEKTKAGEAFVDVEFRVYDLGSALKEAATAYRREYYIKYVMGEYTDEELKEEMGKSIAQKINAVQTMKTERVEVCLVKNSDQQWQIGTMPQDNEKLASVLSGYIYEPKVD